MKNDNYTKFIHTIIALALVFLCADKVYSSTISQAIADTPKAKSTKKTKKKRKWSCHQIVWDEKGLAQKVEKVMQENKWSKIDVTFLTYFKRIDMGWKYDGNEGGLMDHPDEIWFKPKESQSVLVCGK